MLPLAIRGTPFINPCGGVVCGGGCCCCCSTTGDLWWPAITFPLASITALTPSAAAAPETTTPALLFFLCFLYLTWKPKIFWNFLKYKSQKHQCSYLVEVVNGPGIPSAGHSILPDGRQDHPLAETLLKATILAPVPLRFGDFAVAFRHASVHSLVLHRPLEESLAPIDPKILDEKIFIIESSDYIFVPFTGDDAVMESSGLVLANHANHGRVVLFFFHPVGSILLLLATVWGRIVLLLLLLMAVGADDNRPAGTDGIV